jgi:aldehyde dehydrogenase (NAD+)
MNTSQLLIGGKFRGAQDGAELTKTNHVAEKEIGHAADASAADMEQTIQAERKAFRESRWSTDADCAGIARVN